MDLILIILVLLLVLGGGGSFYYGSRAGLPLWGYSGVPLILLVLLIFYLMRGHF